MNTIRSFAEINAVKVYRELCLLAHYNMVRATLHIKHDSKEDIALLYCLQDESLQTKVMVSAKVAAL